MPKFESRTDLACFRLFLHCNRQGSTWINWIQVDLHLLFFFKAPFLPRWVDNKKCIFSVEIEAVTSVHTENEQLDTFLSKTAGLQLGQKPARVADQVFSVNVVLYRILSH